MDFRLMKKHHETLIYSAVGLAALFVILVAVNYLVSAASVRADLTEGKLYTLSDGTRKILRGLQSPVKLRLYVSPGDAMPVPLRAFAGRVTDMVKEFEAAAGPNLVVETYRPRPDSDEEDAAQLDGIEPQQLVTGSQFYLGVAVSRLDRRQAIPAISPQRERLLEYDLARAVARVAAAERTKVGVMSALPVMGMAMNPFTRQSAEPWVLANELKGAFEVVEVDTATTEIPPDVNVLLVIHPRDIQPATEYALDQFVLRGGKLIAFVDPYSFFDQIPAMPGMPPQPGSSSTLPTLFKAWGVEMDPAKVVSDIVYASGAGQRYTPTVLTLNRTAFDRDDVVMGEVENILYPFGGAFALKPAEGLRATVLAQSSRNSMLVPSSEANTSGDAATKSFQPSDQAHPLAVRLTGTFRTAFPDGPPKPPGADGKEAGQKQDEGQKPAADPARLEASKDANSVILVADADLLHDGAAVDIQEIFGRRIVVPSNGNLAFAMGLVEQVAGGQELLSLRSRAAALRPLTVVRELEAEAQKQYFGKIKALEDEIAKTNEKLQSLQKTSAGPAKSAEILTPEQQAELESFRKKVVETRRELKDVRKNLRQDAESLVFWTKVANIAAMPVLVALAGLIVALVRRARVRRAAAA
ncbi:MAG: Gldg family protein [Burkholderiales bacterium]|nr:Gldg family protein [Burkholderiales bacterium]